jgi:DNA-binding Lrp family transcriptional regulator
LNRDTITAGFFGNFGKFGNFRSNMKLTGRQEEFIKKMLELSNEIDGPIHYSVLAERLGVSPFTAYDMLRLLEEKKLVTSEYHLASDKSGPGRAERVFYPTETAKARDERLAKESGAVSLTGEELSSFILDKVRKGEFWEEELAAEVIARIPPDGTDAMRFCMEVMTVVAIRLRQSPGRENLIPLLPEVFPASDGDLRANFCLLGGFAFGILSQDGASDQEWIKILFEQIQQFISIVMTLDPDDSHQIGEYLESVFASIADGE